MYSQKVEYHQDGRERLDMVLRFGEPGDDPQVAKLILTPATF